MNLAVHMQLRVVLVEPLYDGNMGSVARAMKNFGFDRLVMVRPGPIGDFGLAMAVHAKDVLQGARITSTLEEAIDGASLVVGTTGKRSGEAPHHLRLHLRAPCLTPAQLAAKIEGRDGEVALLLGREDWGLRGEELMLCDALVSIPTSDQYPVMNQSHAAAVIFYELSGLCGGCQDLASRETSDLVTRYFERLLYATTYPQHKIPYMVLMVKRILGRAVLTEREAHSLLGVMKKALWRLGELKKEEVEADDDSPGSSEGGAP